MIKVIIPEEPSNTLSRMLDQVLENKNHKVVRDKNSIPSLKNKKIIFAIELPPSGISSNLNDIFLRLFKDNNSMENSQAIVLIHSESLLNTKSYCQHIIYNSNFLGCRFIGRPIVEATKDLLNIEALRRNDNLNKSLESILLEQCSDLGRRFFANKRSSSVDNPKLLVVHSTNKSRSNTYALWQKVAVNLNNIDIKEIDLWNSAINDCIGCSYTVCKAKGMEESCIYKDIVSQEIYPYLVEANGLLLISPNYNDMLNANIIAMINRLTAIFRKYKFYDKKIFSIIVSGHSGIEALAKQIISSVNINKTFQLPPKFCLYAQANEPGSIDNFKNIDVLSKEFALNIEKEIKTI